MSTEASRIGVPHRRVEDRPLLEGRARFLDDLKHPGTLHAAFVRSAHAHALIRQIDKAAAEQTPGVRAVLTLADLKPLLTSERLPLQFRSSELPPGITPFVLAKDEVCYVGETVALVVADSRYIAEDAAAQVMIDYDPLPAASDCRDAAMPGAPPARRGQESNVLKEILQSFGDVSGAFAGANRTVRVQLKQHRGGPHSIEGRGALAVYDENEDRLTVWTSTQLAHEVRAFLMSLLSLDENQIRVVAPEVGGGFGGKYLMYPEEVAVAAACLKLQRPIKWVEDRREHFLSTIQERDQYWDLEAAVDADGRLRGIRGSMIHDQGAYTPQGINLAYNSSTAVPGPYVLPAYEINVQVVETNKVPALSVRGAGYPEGAFAMERVIDEISRQLKLDRAEVRRRNLVSPEQLPYVSPLKTRAGSSITIDSGDFPACQKTVLDAIDYESFPARQAAARREGRYIGIGIGNGVKGTGRGPFETGIVRIGRSGRISVYSGAMPMGQGIRTALAQICAAQFNVSPDDVKVVTGDTSVIPYGLGGFASRQTIVAGSAVHKAAVEVRKKVLEIASHLLETAVDDLELKEGHVTVLGTDRQVALQTIAESVAGVPGYSLPGKLEPGLESTQNFVPPALTYGIGCHAVEVQVDIDTCQVRILRYAVVSDSGKLINPMIVHGQIVGGVVHAIGNALFEWMGYDDQAQPTTTNFADYLLTTATEVPNIDVKFAEYPSPLNPLGVKGVGESGCVPAAAAIVSAIEDALSPFGVQISEYPVTPAYLFDLLTRVRPPSGGRPSVAPREGDASDPGTGRG